MQSGIEMKLVAVSVVAWVTGLAAYVGCTGILWGQGIARPDLNAVMFWSAVALALAVAGVYTPAMFALRRRVLSLGTWWLFPLVSIGLGVVPLFVIVTIFQGSPVSPEAALFYCMFAAFGAVFGVGFYLAYVRSQA